MKKDTLYRYFPVTISILGAVGLGLQLALRSLEDAAGLLPQGHPLHIGSIVLSCTVAGLALYYLRVAKNRCNTHAFPPAISAAGSAIAGFLLLFAGIASFRNAYDLFHSFEAATALICALCLMFMGWCHLKGRKIHLLFHGAVCIFFATHMICQYRVWSGMSQLEFYFFPMFACVFLSLSAYFRTAWEVGMAKGNVLRFCGLMAAFCSICAIADAPNRWFFLAGAIWSLTALPAYSHNPEENTDVSA